jgi:hypothetical protein
MLRNLPNRGVSVSSFRGKPCGADSLKYIKAEGDPMIPMPLVCAKCRRRLYESDCERPGAYYSQSGLVALNEVPGNPEPKADPHQPSLGSRYVGRRTLEV